jgi:ubiquinone/menaquinone biosynthesis C-methylase UbiE
MRLNRVEYALMNNPVRAAIQRRLEAKRLLELGGAMDGGVALETGCGRGVGVEIILDTFGARRVHAFDLDPRMVALARHRMKGRGEQVRIWTGDVTAIPVPDNTYDAVFDFGIIHHVPNWQAGLAEIRRVLRPGGRLYAEEVFESFISHPLWRRLLTHPQSHVRFREGLAGCGLKPIASRLLWGDFGWFVADKPA